VRGGGFALSAIWSWASWAPSSLAGSSATRHQSWRRRPGRDHFICDWCVVLLIIGDLLCEPDHLAKASGTASYADIKPPLHRIKTEVASNYDALQRLLREPCQV